MQRTTSAAGLIRLVATGLFCLLAGSGSASAQDEKAVLVLRWQSREVESIAFSADGSMLVTGGMDGRVRVWDTATGEEQLTVLGPVSSAKAVAFSQDGKKLAAGGYPRRVTLWDVTSGEEQGSLAEERGSIYALAFSPDGKILAMAASVGPSSDSSTIVTEGEVRLWDARQGRETTRLEGTKGGVYSVAFSPDGRMVAAGDTSRGVVLWELASYKVRRSLQQGGGVQSVMFAGGGKTLVAASHDGTVRFWDVAKGTERLAIRESMTGLHWVGLAAEDTVLVSNLRGSVKCWDAVRGKELPTLRMTSLADSVAMTADGRLLAASSGYTVKVWKLADLLGK